MALGVLANSVDVETGKPFKYYDPKTASRVGEAAARAIFIFDPVMQESTVFLDFFDVRIQLVRFVTVTNPRTREVHRNIIGEDERVQWRKGGVRWRTDGFEKRYLE